NCGAEGPTDDPAVRELRERQKRNFLATLILSQGVPMLSHGDELGRTQNGNNNAYCQDNELSWVDWELDDERRALLEFTRTVIAFYQGQPVLQRRGFLLGRSIRGSDVKDIAWLEPSGKEMTDAAWNAPLVRSLGVRLAGDTIPEVNERGERIVGDTLLILMNAHEDPIPFILTTEAEGLLWERVIDTRSASSTAETFSGGGTYELEGRSMVVLRLREKKEGKE
ncbi:MAG: glycogen debranching enzyme GlgX, partial [Deltaproteobacteria bacterium]|nr:glycogen debranching enzyme GlgX [Deltaproteobacteria bacterium]